MTGNLFANGEAYERQMGRWSRLAGAQFLTWLNVPVAQSWLDIGCGNGAFSQEIMERQAPRSLTGIDPSAEQIAFARKRLAVPLAEFQQGDAQDLPFDDGAFDVAIMALVLSFLPAPDKAVAHMARVVRPGGWVAAYMWDLPGGSPVNPVFEALQFLGPAAPKRPNPGASQPDVMQNLWRDAGLIDVETTRVTIDVTYDDFEDFWLSNTAPLGPQGKVIASLSRQDTETFRSELKRILSFEHQGPISFQARANAVKGRVPEAVG
jgi:ubiquinone/menaquinone biosynthesis C-methylase UbiE